MKKILISIWVLISLSLFAQGISLNKNIPPHTHLNLREKINQSDAVVEGTIIDKYTFKNENHIYTSYTLKLLKIFKGELKDSIIEFIIPGGQIPGEEGEITGWTLLSKGFEGFFFFRVNNSNIHSGKTIQSFFYTYGQSGMGYNHVPGYSIAFDGENHYNDLEKDLYEPIEAITHTPRKILGLNSFEIEAQKQKK